MHVLTQHRSDVVREAVDEIHDLDIAAKWDKADGTGGMADVGIQATIDYFFGGVSCVMLGRDSGIADAVVSAIASTGSSTAARASP